MSSAYYVAPPAKAIVLCVDEKPSIQALERAQGYLKLPTWPLALTGQCRGNYKRHGVTTLFATLERRSPSRASIAAHRQPYAAAVSAARFMQRVHARLPTETPHVIFAYLDTDPSPSLAGHFLVLTTFRAGQARSWLIRVERLLPILPPHRQRASVRQAHHQLNIRSASLRHHKLHRMLQPPILAQRGRSIPLQSPTYCAACNSGHSGRKHHAYDPGHGLMRRSETADRDHHPSRRNESR